MAKTREEIDELIRQHEEGNVQQGKDQVWYEIRYIVEFVITYVVLSFGIYTGLAALVSYVRLGEVTAFSLSSNAQYFAGTMMMISAIIFAFSYFAGLAAYRGSMAVRAWSGANKTMSDRSLMADMQALMNPGEIVKGVLLGSIVTLLFYYLYFDQVFL